MSVRFIRKYLKALYILALPVYFYISYSSILNEHSHVNANGIVIMHSHPVNQESGQPLNDHDHSPKEICLFQNLNFDYFDVSDEVQTETIHRIVIQQTPAQESTGCGETKIRPSSPRAPPVVFA